MNKKLAIPLFLMFGYSMAISAEEKHPIDISYSQCMEESGGVTLGMHDCIGQAYENWDKQLNVTYKQLRAKLSPDGKKALLDAQRKWLAYRDSEKELSVQVLRTVEGGTFHGVIFSEKTMKIVRQRTLDFEFYLSNLEGLE